MLEEKCIRWGIPLKENRLETVLEDVHISASDLFTQLQKLNEAYLFRRE